MSPTTTVTTTTTTNDPPPEYLPGLARLATLGVPKVGIVTGKALAYATVYGQTVVGEGETPAAALDALATAAEAAPKPVLVSSVMAENNTVVVEDDCPECADGVDPHPHGSRPPDIDHL